MDDRVSWQCFTYVYVFMDCRSHVKGPTNPWCPRIISQPYHAKVNKKLQTVEQHHGKGKELQASWLRNVQKGVLQINHS